MAVLLRKSPQLKINCCYLVFLIFLDHFASGVVVDNNRHKIELRTLMKRILLFGHNAEKAAPVSLSLKKFNLRSSDDKLNVSPNEGFIADQCQDSEWFAHIGNEHVCIAPLWTISYDPDYCSKMKYGEVYCTCGDAEAQEMKNSIETCVKIDEIQLNGRCNLNPCPNNVVCSDTEPGISYECTIHNISVPYFYGDKKK